MSDTYLSESELLSPSLERRIDQVCNQFEVAWKGKQPPRIEEFLGDTAEPQRSPLLRELIQLDVYYRRSRGEEYRPEDYQGRFPQLDPAWLARALAAPPSAASRSSAPAAERTPEDATGPDTPRPGDISVRAGWVGRTIAHYQVEERLGAGGMGEVYRARDLALGRPAALKLLPEGFSQALRARLLREAWASARLQHPGIATFYEAGEHGGLAFIAMEYVVGQTLRARLQSGALPVEQTLAVTACLLESLGHAHAAGILHRDIKPENIMLTGERSAKLLDFGLAKDVLLEADPTPMPATAAQTESPSTLPAAGQAPDMTVEDVAETAPPLLPDRLEALTRTGAMVGTIGYMSPEQVRGEALDVRSDLFVVAAVLYEMLTGQRAFPGATAKERIAAILSPDPPRISGPGIPPGLEAVLARALDRDPARRYPSAGAFLADLRQLEVDEAVAALPDTLAILDLQNLSDDCSAGWLGSGIANSLAAHLAHVPGLSLLPRPQVVQAQAALGGADSVAALQRLGLGLGCRWLLTGNVQKSATALRVTARLIEVATGQVVSEEHLEGTLEQVFEMQRRLATAVAARLNRGWLLREIPPAVAPKLEAYESYAQGYPLSQRGEKGSQERAQELFERAVSLEPCYAPALAGLALLHTLRFNYTTNPQTLETAADYARRAIQADSRLAETHVWLGYLYTRQGKILEGFEEERKAMELDPSNALAPYFAGALLLTMRRRDALELCKRVPEQPDAPDLHRWRRREALRFSQRAVDLFPPFSSFWVPLGLTHLELGSPAEARWCLEKAVELERQWAPTCFRGVEGYLGECLRRSGALEEARRCCLAGLEVIEKTDNMFRDSSRGSYLCSLGRTALQQGDRDAARAAFRQAALHLRGRPRALGGGHALVQALAGLAQAGEGAEPFEEALQLFEQRQGFDFSWLWLCTDDVSLLELARAARSLGRLEQARDLLAQALDAGSTEALTEEMPGQHA